MAAVKFDDSAATSGVQYEYQVVAFGLNQTSVSTPWIGAPILDGVAVLTATAEVTAVAVVVP